MILKGNAEKFRAHYWLQHQGEQAELWANEMEQAEWEEQFSTWLEMENKRAMTTLNDLNLTRPEKAVLVAALCQVEPDIAPTMQNVMYFQLDFIKKVMKNPAIVGICFLIHGKDHTENLMDKLGIE